MKKINLKIISTNINQGLIQMKMRGLLFMICSFGGILMVKNIEDIPKEPK